MQERDRWKSFESFGVDRTRAPKQIFRPHHTGPSTSQLHQTFLVGAKQTSTETPYSSVCWNPQLRKPTTRLPDGARAHTLTHPDKLAMIASTTTVMLRSGVTRGGCALQPILLRSTTSCPYSTITAASPFASVRSKLSDPTSTSSPAGARPAPASSSPVLTLCRRASTPSTAAAAGRRHASSSSSTPDQDADVAAATRAAQRAEEYARSNPDMPPLDWNSFFQLRKTRRRWQVGFSALMSVGFGAAGAVVLGSGAADALTGQIPLDPILTLGLITLGCTAMGWVLGPSVGNAVFYLIKRKYKAPMTVVSRSVAFLTFLPRVDRTSEWDETLTEVALYRRRASSSPGSRRTALTRPTRRPVTRCLTSTARRSPVSPATGNG